MPSTIPHHQWSVLVSSHRTPSGPLKQMPDRGQAGRFLPTGQPVAKRVEVWLDEPTLALVDTAAGEMGAGRGKAIAALLQRTASGGSTGGDRPADLSDLESLFSPDRKPQFVGKPEGWWERTGVLMAENYAFLADNDCRALVGCVLELQRDSYWRQYSDNWGEFCQRIFHRPAEWVEQVIEAVRVLHCSAEPVIEPAVEPEANPEPIAPPVVRVKAPSPAMRKVAAEMLRGFAASEREDADSNDPVTAATCRREAAQAELAAMKLEHPRQAWEVTELPPGFLLLRAEEAENKAHHLTREGSQDGIYKGAPTSAEIKLAKELLRDAKAFRACAEWLQGC